MSQFAPLNNQHCKHEKKRENLIVETQFKNKEKVWNGYKLRAHGILASANILDKGGTDNLGETEARTRDWKTQGSLAALCRWLFYTRNPLKDECHEALWIQRAWSYSFIGTHCLVYIALQERIIICNQKYPQTTREVNHIFWYIFEEYGSSRDPWSLFYNSEIEKTVIIWASVLLPH